MSTDIFNRKSQTFGGAFSVDDVNMTFGNVGGAGTLIQSIDMRYNQAISMIFEASSTNVYLVAGRTRGEGQMQNIAGPVQIQEAFFQTFGNVCAISDAGNTVVFSFSMACGSSSVKAAYTIGNMIITGVGFSMNAEQMLVTQNLSVMFVSLRYGDQGGGSRAGTGVAMDTSSIFRNALAGAGSAFA